MTITKTSRIEGIDIAADGVVSVRVGKIVSDDAPGVDPMPVLKYRITVQPGDDLTGAYNAANVALAAQGFSAISAGEGTVLGKLISAIQTPAVIAAYKAAHPN